MVTRFLAASPADPVGAIVPRILAGFQEDIPVVDGTKLVGVLGREDVLKAAISGDTSTAVGALMRQDAPRVSESDSLDVALERLQASGLRSIPVVRGDALVGVVPIENIAYLLQMRQGVGASAP